MSQVALDTQWVRQRLSTSLRWASTALAAGLLSVAAFLLLLNHYGGTSDSLRAHGVQTTGHIDSLSRNWRGRDLGWVRVRYRAGTRDLDEGVVVGQHVWRYDIGQSVNVYYDRNEPTRMTINDELNQPAWSVVVMWGLLVGGLLLAASTTLVLVSLLRTRGILASQPWTTDSAQVIEWGGGRSRRTWLLFEHRRPLRLGTTWEGGNEPDLMVQLVVRGHRAVVSVPGSEKVQTARTPRRIPHELRRASPGSA